MCKYLMTASLYISERINVKKIYIRNNVYAWSLKSLDFALKLQEKKK